MRNDQDKTRVLLLLVVRQQEQKVLRVFRDLITRTLIGICTLTLTAASNSQSLPSGFL